MSFKKSLFCCLLIIFSLSCAKDDLRSIIVLGKRLDYSSQYVFNKAADIEVLDESAITDSKASSTVDLIKNVSGIDFDYMGIGEKFSLNIRGYSSKPGVLVLVNGIVQNDSNNHSVNWEFIPLENIKRIEIIKGGSSVIYGAGAVGGVINITTKSPDNIGTKVFFESGSFNSYKKGFNFGTKLGDLPVSLMVGSNKKEGKHARENSDYEALNNNYSVLIDVTNRLSLKYSNQNGDSKSFWPGPLTYSEYQSSPNMATTGYGSGDFYKDNDSIESYNIDWSLDFAKASIKFYKKLRNQYSFSSVTNFNVSSDIKKQGSIVQTYIPVSFLGNDHKVVLGYEQVNDDLKVKNNVCPTSSMIADTKSWFFSDQFMVGNEFLIDWGYRADQIKYDYKKIYLYFDMNTSSSVYGSGSKTYSGQSPALGITLFPEKELSLYGNYNRSFKVMPLEDFAVYHPSYNVNTSVDPQISDTVELGGNWAVKNDLNLKANVYYSSVDNEILHNDFIRKNENFKTEHKGYSVEADYTPISMLELRVSFQKDFATLKTSGLSSFFMVTGNSISNIPQYILNASARISFTDAFAQINIKNVGSAFAVNDFSQSGKKLDAYLILDLISQFKYDVFTIYLRVDNLTDTNYVAYSGYGVNSRKQTFYPGNRRAFSFGVTCEF